MGRKVANDRKRAEKAEQESVEYRNPKQNRLQLESNTLSFRVREYGVSNTRPRGMKKRRETDKHLVAEMKLCRHCALQGQLKQSKGV